jgi:hypothetical protein
VVYGLTFRDKRQREEGQRGKRRARATDRRRVLFVHTETAVRKLVGLAEATGFRVVARYGNYDRSPFDPATSPFFICKLARGAPALDS